MDGMSQESEDNERMRCVLQIEEMGVILRSNRFVVATACVLLHRFYTLQSFKEHNRFIVTAACHFLASKVEEEPRSIEEVAKASLSVLNGAEEPGTTGTAGTRGGDDITTTLNEILLLERLLLQTLSFDMQVIHPYEAVSDILKGIKHFVEHSLRDVVRDQAIKLLNDSYRGPMCLLFEPKLIAAAAIYIVLIQAQIKPTKSSPRSAATSGARVDVTGRSWVQIFRGDFGVDEAVLRKASEHYLSIYRDAIETK